MYGILLKRLLLCYNICILSIMGFLYGWCEHLFVNELNNEYLPDKYFKTVFWVAKSSMAVCFNYFLSMAIFLNIYFSQGSVATYLTRYGIVKHESIANLPLSLSVEKVWKSVNIWGSYGQEFSVLFFDSWCVQRNTSTTLFDKNRKEELL